jgi:hypothetical protein
MELWRLGIRTGRKLEDPETRIMTGRKRRRCGDQDERRAESWSYRD